MAKSRTVLVYTTAPSREVAEDLARHLIGSKLIACANIMPGMISVYRWNGAVETSNEVAMILKTQQERADAVIAAIEERHPYDTPAAVVLQASGGSVPFLEWISAETVLP